MKIKSDLILKRFFFSGILSVTFLGDRMVLSAEKLDDQRKLQKIMINRPHRLVCKSQLKNLHQKKISKSVLREKKLLASFLIIDEILYFESLSAALSVSWGLSGFQSKLGNEAMKTVVISSEDSYIYKNSRLLKDLGSYSRIRESIKKEFHKKCSESNIRSEAINRYFDHKKIKQKREDGGKKSGEYIGRFSYLLCKKKLFILAVKNKDSLLHCAFKSFQEEVSLEDLFSTLPWCDLKKIYFDSFANEKYLITKYGFKAISKKIINNELIN